jgi:hypothetical protein
MTSKWKEAKEETEIIRKDTQAIVKKYQVSLFIPSPLLLLTAMVTVGSKIETSLFYFDFTVKHHELSCLRNDALQVFVLLL